MRKAEVLGKSGAQPAGSAQNAGDAVSVGGWQAGGRVAVSKCPGGVGAWGVRRCLPRLGLVSSMLCRRRRRCLGGHGRAPCLAGEAGRARGSRPGGRRPGCRVCERRRRGAGRWVDGCRRDGMDLQGTNDPTSRPAIGRRRLQGTQDCVWREHISAGGGYLQGSHPRRVRRRCQITHRVRSFLGGLAGWTCRVGVAAMAEGGPAEVPPRGRGACKPEDMTSGQAVERGPWEWDILGVWQFWIIFFLSICLFISEGKF